MIQQQIITLEDGDLSVDVAGQGDADERQAPRNCDSKLGHVLLLSSDMEAANRPPVFHKESQP